jgi:hypothetical protein
MRGRARYGGRAAYAGGAVYARSPSATLYSVDPNPLGHAIKLSFLQRAQLDGPQARLAQAHTGSEVSAMRARGRRRRDTERQ